MYEPRSLSLLQQEYLATLARLNSPLTDTSPGSVIYSIARCSAAMHNEMELLLNESLNNFSLANLAGERLDVFCEALGIYRKEGNYAHGFALFSTDYNSTVIEPSRLLVHTATGHEYATANTEPILVDSLIEVSIPVVAMKVGREYNLPAGTKLFLPPISDKDIPVEVRVGHSRVSGGIICGNISGGSEAESDLELKQRLINSLTAKGGANSEFIRQRALSHILVDDAKVHTTVGGIVEVWVKAANILNPDQLVEIREYLRPYLPAGILIAVFQLRQALVDFDVFVPYSTEDYDVIATRINSIIDNYLAEIPYREPLRVEVLQEKLRPYSLIKPLKDIVPQPDEVFVRRKLNLTYEN